MVAGVERYFQIARCFRDEDQRGNRQPEFTQLDLEMSFVEREDVISIIEELFTSMVETLLPEKRLMAKPWPRFTYAEVMERFGRDAPDIRFALELGDITDLAGECGFQIFEKTVASGGLVRGLNAKGWGNSSRKEIDALAEFIKPFGAKGMAYIALTDSGEIRSSFAKFLEAETQTAIQERLEAQNGDLLLFVADDAKVVSESLGRLRDHIAEQSDLIDPDVLGFCWVLDFPFVEWNEDRKCWDPCHHLFTSPMPEDIELLDKDPGVARGQQYDMVLNGVEVGGGSIRIHDRKLQERVFSLIGLEENVARERFGHMLEAFEFGTPPHGGIASGIDRLLMIFASESHIRDVIAFPKNNAGRDVMINTPSTISEEQLNDLHLRLYVKEKQ